ncbi:hypothetical protein [Sphingomicrobium astaxanthinifaciens]|uniref:hypothetical protein n=1 Tax=Sphingomicrobium astaxanthinifaciens TaxID=1227949 RepID=UPI001FCC568E|nr:hypothetical protein [Sphingomicrobium astaxanthinifaciens]MCJ7421998.1 hypothetical protein [Sphingomicrobium astaxanthinifaciens]
MRALLFALALAAIAAPGAATSFGPLAKTGVTDGPRKGFYLQLRNAYRTAQTFELHGYEADGVTPAARLAILPATTRLGGGRQRRVLVIVDGLAPGETRRVRVCAARAPQPEESLYARICSTLVARRLPRRARGG